MNKNLIHVIRSKDPSTNKFKYYSSLLGGDKQYIYSFTSKNLSNKCYDFLKSYKLRYNRYPDLNVNSKMKKISNDIDISIEIEILNDFKGYCLINNVGLISIDKFDYTFIDNISKRKDIYNLSISAIDLLENEEVSKKDYINNLELIYYLE